MAEKLDFKNYFKFPLIFKENFLYVLTNDGKMALTWLVDQSKLKDAYEIINKINGYSDKKFDKEWTVKDHNFIYYDDKKIFLVRGWGMLTGTTQYAYGLEHSAAAKIQDNFAKYIVEQLNK